MEHISRIGTHSGSFHADDATGIAILKALYPKARIIRSRRPADWAWCDVLLDVGGVYDPRSHRYDHHQPEFSEGGCVEGEFIPYASAGLIWKHFGRAYVNVISPQPLTSAQCDEIAKKIYEEFIHYIDMADVGMKLPGPFSISIMGMVSRLNPTHLDECSEEVLYAKFLEAVHLVQGALKQLVLDLVAELIAKEEVRAAERDATGQVLVLDKGYPWTGPVTQMPEILYVVYPSSDGSWMVQCARDAEDSFVNRKALPDEWAGLRDAQLASVSGVQDAIFCHRGRFIAGAKSRDGALALASLAVDLH